MNFEITGTENGDQLIKKLVALRLLARTYARSRECVRRTQEMIKKQRADEHDNSPRAAYLDAQMLQAKEHMLNIKFAAIGVGQFTASLCAEIDKKVPRAAIFDALCVGLADRYSPEVQEYGISAIALIAVLHLENSATKSDAIEIQPLSWCCQMALMNAMQTKPKMDEAVHEAANQVFNDAFGEYRPRPLMERLAGRAV